MSNIFSYAELRDCADRELKMRVFVYRDRVERHKMSQRKADLEIAMMTAIKHHFYDLAQDEKLL